MLSLKFHNKKNQLAASVKKNLQSQKANAQVYAHLPLPSTAQSKHKSKGKIAKFFLPQKTTKINRIFDHNFINDIMTPWSLKGTFDEKIISEKIILNLHRDN